MFVPTRNFVLVDWKKIRGRLYLYFEFHNTLTVEVVEDAIAKWAEETSTPTGVKKDYSVICNLLNLTRYDGRARKEWQKAFYEFRTHFDKVWVISENIFLKTGTRSMGLLSDVEVKTVSRLDDIS